jgi:AraC-like DNA-binding protein/ligand-binding sensor protein
MQTTNGSNSPPADPASEQGVGVVPLLRQSEVFRDYQDAFETTTGLPLAIRAAGSFQPPLHGSKQANPFCALMAARNKSCAACLQLQQRIEESATAEPKTLECFAGLNDSAVPLRVGKNVIGYLQTGQVLLRSPSKSRFRDTVSQLSAWGVVGEVGRLEPAYFQTRVIPKRQYESLLRLLAIFAEQLALLSNQIIIRAAAADSPAMAKARRFIAENLSEELSLARVAQVANMSPTHFCRVFRQQPGITFMNYLGRERVEIVKQELLNPQMRVSEAAFAAGFQSLSQFGRVFRRITGEAPSDYRERLQGSERGITRNIPLVNAA